MKSPISKPISFTILLALAGCSKAFFNLQDVTYYFPIDGMTTIYIRREFLSDSIFIETEFNVRKKPVGVRDTFKVIGEKMYYMCDNRFYQYFSKEEFEKGDTFCQYSINPPYLRTRLHCEQFVPCGKGEFKGKTVYGFSCLRLKEGESINEQFIVYFLPGFGIVQEKSYRSELTTIRLADW